MPIWRYLEGGGKRAVGVWHRRAGKDDVCLHWAATCMVQRTATYWHMLPEAAQARKAIWEAVNPHTGQRRIDEAFPIALRETTREQEMLIKLKGGSTWQVVGSDNYNSLVGSAPAGVVFSEWALADPAAWAYIRPILAENGGWALFIYTPRGRNHAATFYESAEKDPAWFAQKLTVEETKAISAEILEQERKEYLRDYGEEDGRARFQQEYFCSFQSGVVGAYYGREMERVERDKRLCPVPYDPRVPVFTAWDLGVSDSTAIWFAQIVGREVHVIDYLENSGVGLDWYANALRERGYSYHEHLLPHDAKARELSSGKTREETLRSLGFNNIRVLPQGNLMDGINAARLLLARAWFDETKCGPRGVKCLQEYRREWDDKRKVFHDRPLHDWSSHGADAWRYLAVGLPDALIKPKKLVYPKLGIV